MSTYIIILISFNVQFVFFETNSSADMCEMDEPATYEVVANSTARSGLHGEFTSASSLGLNPVSQNFSSLRCQRKDPLINQALAEIELFSDGKVGTPAAQVCEAQNIEDFRATLENFYRFSKAKYNDVLKEVEKDLEKEKPQTYLYDSEQRLTTALTVGKGIASKKISSALENDKMNIKFLMPPSLELQRMDSAISAGLSLGSNAANFVFDAAAGTILRGCKKVGGLLYHCGLKYYQGESLRDSVTETAVNSAVGSVVSEIPIIGPVVGAAGDCIDIKNALIESKEQINSYFFKLKVHLKAAEKMIREKQGEVLKAAQKEQEIFAQSKTSFDQSFQEGRVSCLCDTYFRLEKTLGSFQKRVKDEEKKYETFLIKERAL